MELVGQSARPGRTKRFRFWHAWQQRRSQNCDFWSSLSGNQCDQGALNAVAFLSSLAATTIAQLRVLVELVWQSARPGRAKHGLIIHARQQGRLRNFRFWWRSGSQRDQVALNAFDFFMLGTHDGRKISFFGGACRAIALFIVRDLFL